MKKFLFVILILSISRIISAQTDFDFNYDYTQFRYDSTKNYFEIYYLVYPNQFTLEKTDNDLHIDGLLSIYLKDIGKDSVLLDKTWEISEQFKDSNDFRNQNSLLGVVGVGISEGEHEFQIKVNDGNDSSKVKIYTEKINIDVMKYRDVSISEIQLSSRILNDNVNKNSIFYKNTLEVYPNPSAIFTHSYPILYYYCELYNLSSTNEDSLNLIKKLNNSQGLTVYSKSRQVLSNQKSIVDVGFINLRSFPTDSYTIELTLKDSKGTQLSNSKKRIFFVNPDVKKDVFNQIVKDYMSTEFGVLSGDECDDMFNKSKIIASSDEIDQYELLDSLDSKREFLFNFWQRRDDVPETPINEFKANYFNRINTAIERYSTVANPGYETDRGRIYARFGEPDEIERHPNETDSKPYEIWFYNQIEGGVYFVFGDYTGFSNYELLHSTLRGELQDPQWMRRLRTN